MFRSALLLVSVTALFFGVSDSSNRYVRKYMAPGQGPNTPVEKQPPAETQNDNGAVQTDPQVNDEEAKPNPQDNSLSDSGINQDESIDDKDSPATDDTGSNAEDDTGSNAEDDTGSNAEDDTGSNAEDDTGSNAEDDTGSNAEDDTGSNAEDDTGSNAEDDTGSNAEDDADVPAGDDDYSLDENDAIADYDSLGLDPLLDGSTDSDSQQDGNCFVACLSDPSKPTPAEARPDATNQCTHICIYAA